MKSRINPAPARLLTLTTLAIATGAVFAQATPPAKVPEAASGGYQLPAIRVDVKQGSEYAPAASSSATKTAAALRDVPQAVNVVSEELIRDQAAHSLQDVLQNVPGVGLSSGDGQRDQVTIRGFTAISDQFVDGIRDDALYFRDLSNIERVEVIKGPAAVLYGRGSSGGLINRVTKKPQPGNFGELTLNLGSNELKRVALDANVQVGDGVALRLTGAHEDSGSYRDQGFVRRTAVAPSLAAKLGASTRLLVQAEHATDKRITDFGIPSYNGRPVDVAPSTYYGSGDARRDDTSTSRVSSLTVTLDHRFSESLSLRNVTRRYTYDLDRNNTQPSGTVDATTMTVSRSRGQVSREESGWFNQTELSLRQTLAGLQHDWLAGIEIGRQNKDQNFISQNNIDRVPLFNPGSVLPPAMSAATLAAANPAHSVFDVAGVYLQDQLTLSPRWKALLGLRYDTFDQSTAFARTGAPLSRKDKTWSPRAGLLWQPSDWASHYLSVSKSFQPSGENFALAANNANSDPEQTRNVEVGSKLDLFDGALAVTASLFNLERTGIKTNAPGNPGVLINVGEQRTHGLELTAAGRLPQGWDVSAGYAYLDGRITRSNASQASPQTPVEQIPLQGKRPSLTPRHSASLWAVKQLGGGFSAGGGLRYSADRYASASNAVVLPGYVTADLAAYYRSRAFDIALHLKNASNRRYIVSAHGAVDNLLVPGAPRAVELSATYRF
ncbi:TonB-dependent siderophore receptor [Mitsuaria sp. WAJ17]|uniref:TonB-dependent receptor n=1 Tax=Mitsuaria sp. WAJ17 TaxID=2761452 RepID=UPI0016012035|nr:TonB-dependent siderophore receptor [Mitsuaria sp. WAJ17]MBB2483806.1 TonB-dependent siderophore receptor [Mitsuaria sp. WAJ17]